MHTKWVLGEGMIRHLAFFEALAAAEARSDSVECAELLAGALVLRLCDVWHIDPGAAARTSAGYRTVSGYVRALPARSATRVALRNVLRTLVLTRPGGARATASTLGDYARLLAHAGFESLAAEARNSAARTSGQCADGVIRQAAVTSALHRSALPGNG